jgi:excisionase family DNA binding protein
VREPFEYVSVSEAAVRLGVSPTTVREMIRRGDLEAERMPRPQGSVYMVKLKTPEAPTSDDAQPRSEDERARTDSLEALQRMIDFADTFLRAQGETIIRQAEQVAELREERGTLAEQVRHERARAERAEAALEAARRPWWRRLFGR